MLVLGAGLAGLHAARLLHAAGVDVVLVEARDRLGGRILSVDADGQPSDDGFDLGPSWYWPDAQPALGALVAQLGLQAFAQASEGDVIVERMSREAPRRYRGIAQEARSMRIAGGTAALVRALAGALPPARIVIGARATAMILGDHGVEVSLAPAQGPAYQVTAAHVIAALPPRLLAHAVAFTPAPPAPTLARWRDTPTWMAPHAKFVALYDQPFWRDAGLSGTAQSMVGPMAEIHDATTASGRAALFGFVGVAAEQRAAVGEAAVSGACVDQLVRLFGPAARSPRATLLKDWAADPLTATAADRVPGGHPLADATPWVDGPWQGRLALAGSETSPAEPGYLAGAVVAATRAVEATLARLGR